MLVLITNTIFDYLPLIIMVQITYSYFAANKLLILFSTIFYGGENHTSLL